MLNGIQQRKIRNFRRGLFIWGEHNVRSFFWRRKPSIYNILIAEFFLQRTKALQAEKQFKIFINHYPNFLRLKNISVKELEKYFIPLGLKKKIKIFKKLVLAINKKYGGKIPTEYSLLTKLPGVGDYTASAIEVFALNRRKPLVDANTIRIFSCLMDKKISHEEGKRSKLVRECAAYFSSLGKDPRKTNWLLLDYGAKK